MVNVLSGMGFALLVLVWIAISIAIVCLCGHLVLMCVDIWKELQSEIRSNS